MLVSLALRFAYLENSDVSGRCAWASGVAQTKPELYTTVPSELLRNRLNWLMLRPFILTASKTTLIVGPRTKDDSLYLLHNHFPNNLC